MGSIKYGYITDTGVERDHNEDNLLVLPDYGLWIVADGMGGHEGGEVASKLAVETISELVKKGQNLTKAIEKAHEAIIKAARQGEGNKGMGSTVVAMKISGLDYEIAWVGDSRAYLFDGALKQLTRDHSFVQNLLDSNAITPEEAHEHPQKNVISQALGAEDLKKLQVDSIKGRLYKGQRILLCSDGLTGELDDGQISDILQQEGEDQALVEQLVQTAKDSGGSDNISVILCSAPEDAPKPSITKKITRPIDAAALQAASQQGRKQKRFVLPIALVLIILLVVLAWIFVPIDNTTKTGGGVPMGSGGEVKDSGAGMASTNNSGNNATSQGVIARELEKSEDKAQDKKTAR